MDSLALLGANGIFGVGLFLKDCGSLCAANTTTMYYDCAGPNAFAETALELASQVSNPAALFAQDNNSAILTLPTVPDTGAPAASGSLIFEIGTQTNNVLTASVTTVPADGATAGNFTAHTTAPRSPTVSSTAARQVCSLTTRPSPLARRVSSLAGITVQARPVASSRCCSP